MPDTTFLHALADHFRKRRRSQVEESRKPDVNPPVADSAEPDRNSSRRNPSHDEGFFWGWEQTHL